VDEDDQAFWQEFLQDAAGASARRNDSTTGSPFKRTGRQKKRFYQGMWQQKGEDGPE
jgi:hypothetical protein